jgi:hypothetical protein
MNIMNENTLDINAQVLIEQAKTIVNVLEDAFEQRRATHEVEQSLFRCAIQMGRRWRCAAGCRAGRLPKPWRCRQIVP